MGKLKQFSITFDNCKGVYYAGEVVRGQITIDLNEPMKMRELRLTCLGRAYVHWSELENVGRRGGRQRLETVEYSAEEGYFKHRFRLWGKDLRGEDTNCMQPGHHTFPFDLLLPATLPSSFEGSYGYIRYWVKGTIDKPWKFDHHCKKAFTVIANLDLNKEPQASDPIRCEGEVNAGCWLCKCGGYSAIFCTNCRGCVPGEVLLLYTEVENHTRWSNCSAEIRLKLVMSYHTDRKSRQEKKVITRLKHDRLSSGNEDIWTEAFTIPPLPPSHLKGCSIIDTKYVLQFICETDGCNCDAIEFDKEIIIGTIPMCGPTPGTFMPHPLPIEPPPYYTPFSTKDTVAEAAAKAKKTKLIQQSPPSYEECVFGRVNIKDKDDTDYTQGDLVFTPMYAYYDMADHTKDDTDD
ncbi:arrestin domain-containing protein 3-like [Haliotis rubra]|uniref:arrestin domain-containing protein 3-like n=1 Tax=Haliotis rubra TaxID=36100 RepID=UPI001EE5B933|nr:arrestin domain-containing protein 3-like [Haliotis rubra]